MPGFEGFAPKFFGRRRSFGSCQGQAVSLLNVITVQVILQ